MNTYTEQNYKTDLDGNLRQIFKKGQSLKLKFEKEHIEFIKEIFNITTKGFYICDYETFKYEWNKMFNQKINKAVFNHIVGMLARNGKINMTLLNKKIYIIKTPEINQTISH